MEASATGRGLLIRVALATDNRHASAGYVWSTTGNHARAAGPGTAVLEIPRLNPGSGLLWSAT